MIDKFYHFIYFIVGCAGSSLLHGLFPGCGERGCSLGVVRGLLTAVAPLVAEHRLEGAQVSVAAARGLGSCGSWSQLPRGRWYLPRSGIEPMPPALAGRLFFFF